MVHTAIPSPAASAPSFFGLSRVRLAERLAGMGVPGFRADQLYSWVYRKHQREAGRMLNLPA